MIWSDAPDYYGDYHVSHADSHLKRCPECGAIFLYTCRYDFLMGGSEDEAHLTRLRDPVLAFEELTAHRPDRKVEQEYHRQVAISLEDADDAVRKLVRAESATDDAALQRYHRFSCHLAGREIDMALGPAFLRGHYKPPEAHLGLATANHVRTDPEVRCSFAVERMVSTPRLRRGLLRLRALRPLVVPVSPIRFHRAPPEKCPMRLKPDCRAGTLEVRRVRKSLLSLHAKNWNPERDAILSRDGRWLATLQDEWIRIWEVARGVRPRRIATALPNWSTTLLCFSADARLLLTSHRNGLGKDLFRAWDRKSGQVRWEYEDSDFHNPKAAFSVDGGRVAVADTWEGVRVFDVRSGRELFRFHRHREHYIRSVEFSADGNALRTVAGSEVRTWDLRPEAHVRLRGHRGPVVDVGASPDGALFFSRSEEEVSVWEARTGNWVVTVQSRASSAAFSEDGRHLVTTYAPRGAFEFDTVWDARSGVRISRSPEPLTKGRPARRGEFELRVQGKDTALFASDGDRPLAWLPGRLRSVAWAGRHFAAASAEGDLGLYEVCATSQ